jgi:MFS family permease
MSTTNPLPRLAPQPSNLPEEIDSRRGWRVVAAAVIATSVLLGISYAFSVLIDPLRAEFDAGHKAAALAFSLTVALPFLLAPIAGNLSDRYGPRPLLAAAAALSTSGLLLSSAAPNIWIVYLTYCLGVGGAASLAFVPLVAAVGGWFEERRTLALAIALTGTGAGTLVAAPLIGTLAHTYGFRPTCLALAGMTAMTLPLAAALAARPPQPATPASSPNRKDGFARLYLAGIAGSSAALIMFAFLVPSAIEHGIDHSDAAWLLAIAGGANIAGRLLIPTAVRRRGLLGSYRTTMLMLATSGALWLGTGGTLPALILLAFVLGSAYGAFVALSPAVAMQLLGVTALGRRLGTLYTSAGIGALAGPTLAGATIDITGGYTAASGLVITAAVAATLALPPGRVSARSSTKPGSQQHRSWPTAAKTPPQDSKRHSPPGEVRARSNRRPLSGARPPRQQ